MSNRSRAWRRHQRERAIAHAKEVLRVSWYADKATGAEEAAKVAPRFADHLAFCSCLQCGNRRRYEGPTMQERRASL